MPARGDTHCNVALQGFSEFERSGLTSFFRLAADRTPAYRQVSRVEDADFIIADADDAGSLRGTLALDRAEDTVYVGRNAPLGALHWLPRPIEPTRIVRALDAIISQRKAAPPLSLAALSMAALARLDAGDTAPAPFEAEDDPFALPPVPESERTVPMKRPAAAAAPVVAANAAEPRPAPAVATPAVPVAPPPERRPAAARRPVPTLSQVVPDVPSIAGFVDDEEGNGPDVLVADDSRIARRFLQQRLQRLGYRVHLASDGDEVLELLTQQRFSLVFLDITLGSADSIDGLAICQHLKQHPDYAGPEGPKVLMVTGLSGATDRVRGSLAGCDAYLTKPLTEADLLKTLQVLDPGLAGRPRPTAAR